ncbi:MAG: hypothetical protein LBT85_00365 [Bifidobacteriaceae bacterium]|jgi:hypothetical protein|nr:hypothetical protein [Bifidobacteriaceae bacterium]
MNNSIIQDKKYSKLDEGLKREFKINFIQEYEFTDRLFKHGISILDNQELSFCPSILPIIYTIMSLAIEKYLKLFVIMIHIIDDDSILPNNDLRINYGHNLKKLNNKVFEWIKNNTQKATNIDYLEAIIKNIPDKNILNDIITALSKFAQNGRFYYLDNLLLQSSKLKYKYDNISPTEKWEEIETKINEKHLHYSLENAGGPEFEKGLAKQLMQYFKSWVNVLFQAGFQGLFGELGKLLANDIGTINPINSNKL